MANVAKSGSDGIDRRNRADNDRIQASNIEATAAGMGVAAGSLILGALLPHQSTASANNAGQTVSSPSSNDHQDITATETDQLPLTSAGNGPEHAERYVSPEQENTSDKGTSHLQPSDFSQDAHQFGSVISHDSTESLNAYSPGTGSHDSGNYSTSANQSLEAVDAHERIADLDHSVSSADSGSSIGGAVSHAYEAVANSFGNVMDSVHNVATFASTSLASTFDSLSSSLGRLTQQFDNSTSHSVDETLGTLLHSASSNLLDGTHGADASTGIDVHSVVPALALLATLPSALLGGQTQATNTSGLLNEKFGASPTTIDTHLSSMSFADGLQPIHIGFAGQALSHMLDSHDISGHGLGSALHGFV